MNYGTDELIAKLRELSMELHEIEMGEVKYDRVKEHYLTSALIAGWKLVGDLTCLESWARQIKKDPTWIDRGYP